MTAKRPIYLPDPTAPSYVNALECATVDVPALTGVSTINDVALTQFLPARVLNKYVMSWMVFDSRSGLDMQNWNKNDTTTQPQYSTDGGVTWNWLTTTYSSSIVQFYIPEAGTWQFSYSNPQRSDAGIFEMLIDGNVVSTNDGYTSSGNFQVCFQLVLTQGIHDIQVRCLSKNPSSTGYITLLGSVGMSYYKYDEPA